jgi:hypothetical protein
MTPDPMVPDPYNDPDNIQDKKFTLQEVSMAVLGNVDIDCTDTQPTA